MFNLILLFHPPTRAPLGPMYPAYVCLFLCVSPCVFSIRQKKWASEMSSALKWAINPCASLVVVERYLACYVTDLPDAHARTHTHTHTLEAGYRQGHNYCNFRTNERTCI